MSTVAERCIGGHLAVAKFVIPRLINIKTDWSASSQNPLALPIAERIDLWVTTRAPVVWLSSAKEHMSGENTSVRWHAWRTVPSFFVWSWLLQVNNLLFREVCHVVHRLRSTLELSWLEDNWSWCHYVTLVSLHLASNRAETQLIVFRLT